MKPFIFRVHWGKGREARFIDLKAFEKNDAMLIFWERMWERHNQMPVITRVVKLKGSPQPETPW